MAHAPASVVTKTKRIALTPALRQAVLERDDYTCRYCDHRPDVLYETDWWGRRRATLHIDHVIPVAAGGRNTMSNLVTACADCNLRKGAELRDECVDFVRRIEHQEADHDAAVFTAWIHEFDIAQELD